ncbi:hypothetical protein ACHAXR_003679, partial [Thalassiosira sp. AJA248-18]
MTPMRVIMAALAATGASAALWSDIAMAEDLGAQALERRHNLAGMNQKGTEKQKRGDKNVLTDEQKKSIQARMLKRGRGGVNPGPRGGVAVAAVDDTPGLKKRPDRGQVSGLKKPEAPAVEDGKASAIADAIAETGQGHQGKPLLQNMMMGAAKHDAKSGKGMPPAKAPSNTPYPPPTTSRGPKTEKIQGKSRKVSMGICTKRLDIAFELITALGPNGPFGTILEPSDVTELCEFNPPEEGDDPNFGCPFLFVPDIGFLEGEEFVEVLGEEPGKAFESLVFYCQCHQGYDLGCAAKIPHGPPASTASYTDSEGNTKEVMVPSYSEYIPFSTPADRAEYCKMVGVWNGDFESDVVADFTEDVNDCGCFFAGQAKEMVGQCPGVDLGAFFVFPEETMAPTPDETTAPTPSIPGTTYYESFEEATFPEDEEWSVAPAVEFMSALPASDLKTNLSSGGKGGAGEKLFEELHNNIKTGNNRARRLEEEEEGEDDVWALTDEDASQGVYSIKSPDLGIDNSITKFAVATLTVGDDWMTPGWLDFSVKMKGPSNDVFDLFGYFVDGFGYVYGVTETDWEPYYLWVPAGAKEVTFEYLYNAFEIPEGSPDDGVVLVDELMFYPSTPFPTYSPTVTAMPT